MICISCWEKKKLVRRNTFHQQKLQCNFFQGIKSLQKITKQEIESCVFCAGQKAVNIRIYNPHYTARPAEQQQLSTEIQGSHNVAPNSIHWGSQVPEDIKRLTVGFGDAAIGEQIKEELKKYTKWEEDKDAIIKKMQSAILYKIEECETVNVEVR